MKAMILAAGFGTRLRPLTDKKPKALMPVVNKPIIARNIGYLKAHGVTQIVVNVHHHYQQVLEYLDGRRPFELPLDVRVEPEILGTGGGIKNTADFWDDEPFIVVNTDILTDINLTAAYEEHKKSGALATLVLHDREPFNQVQIDSGQRLTDIAKQNISGRFAFTGLHIMEPEFLSFIPDGVFSDVIDVYRRLFPSERSVRAYFSEGHYWRDIGNVESYIQANKELADEVISIGADCRVHPSARLEEWVVMGDGCHLEEGVELRRSILWEGVRVKAGKKVVDSIVTAFNRVEEDLIGQIQ